MNLTATVQDYVKAIYLLQQDSLRVSNSQLAARFTISAPAVTDMLKKLVAHGLVDYHPRAGVRLSEAGIQIALEVIQRHRLIEQYLVTALGMSWETVHAEAEVLEHVVSKTLAARIAAFLDAPHAGASPAPAGDSHAIRLPRPLQSLASLAPGRVATVIELDDGDSARLHYLTSLGLVPNTRVVVQAHAPFDGPLTLDIGDRAIRQHLDARLAARVFVHPA